MPTKLRNPLRTTRNTSTILMIIDTRREVQYGIGEHFSQTILKEREMMASASALEYL